MLSIGIRELQTNPATLTNALEAKQFTMITKRSNPIGVAVALDDTVLGSGLKTSLLIASYQDGIISLGQLAKSLDISKKKAMHLLSMMGMDIIEYEDFEEDLKSIETLL